MNTELDFPKYVPSGLWKEGHVQGIAVDAKNGFIYYSFTTILLKTDLAGNPVGSVKNIVGHLGCITFDADRGKVYGSLELKHDAIGKGIMERTGKALAEEDAFYLVCFDADKIDRMEMDAESDGVMSAVWLADPLNDYYEADEVSGEPHRYGCSGIDGTGYGPVFGADKDSEKKIMVAYGIYGDNERSDNDNQVIVQYSPEVFTEYGKPLTQAEPHHSGPEKSEERYFLHTGNTNWGVQNLEYDAFSGAWLVAVYIGNKPQYENFKMFFIDGKIPAKEGEVFGRNGERGKNLSFAKIGKTDDGKRYGCHFSLGSTGVYSFGDGRFYFSRAQGNNEEKTFSGDVYMYTMNMENEKVFEMEE